MRFMHWRNKDANGIVSNFGGVTFAFDVIDDELVFSATKCSKKDRFCKQQGRLIAGGRLAKALEGKGNKFGKVSLQGRKPVEVLREFIEQSRK